MTAKPAINTLSVIAPEFCTAVLYYSYVYYHKNLLSLKEFFSASGNNYVQVKFNILFHINYQIPFLVCLLPHLTFSLIWEFGMIVFKRNKFAYRYVELHLPFQRSLMKFAEVFLKYLMAICCCYWSKTYSMNIKFQYRTLYININLLYVY